MGEDSVYREYVPIDRLIVDHLRERECPTTDKATVRTVDGIIGFVRMRQCQSIDLLEIIEGFFERIANRFCAIRDFVSDRSRRDLGLEFGADVPEGFRIKVKVSRDVGGALFGNVLEFINRSAVDLLRSVNVKL